jgi:hypothetical protein
MGNALNHLRQVWDEVTDDFLRGQPTNVKAPLDEYFHSYRRYKDVQLGGFCEPFLGPLDRVPKMAFLSLNPGNMHPAWQSLNANGREGTFVSEIKRAGSYSHWAAGWSYLKPGWQSFIATQRGPNHHLVRQRFMTAWYEDGNLGPQDRVDFELYPWHSRRFYGGSLRLDDRLVREFVLEPLGELKAPIVFAFGRWWWANLEHLGVEIIARLGDGTDRPLNIGYKDRSTQGIIIGRAAHGGYVIAEKHSGPPPGPPAVKRVALLRKLVSEVIDRNS